MKKEQAVKDILKRVNSLKKRLEGLDDAIYRQSREGKDVSSLKYEKSSIPIEIGKLTELSNNLDDDGNGYFICYLYEEEEYVPGGLMPNTVIKATAFEEAYQKAVKFFGTKGDGIEISVHTQWKLQKLDEKLKD